MPNHLAAENSPYLLQHAHNPVDWYPWGEEALAKAREEDKPIFLSIGYAACHWCHVMAHESFEDPETAGIMNRFYVNIKVDREERPDLDSIYMEAVVSMTGQGGWPLSVFLTPEGQPFFGGTYYPPVQRYNIPSFKDVLINVHDVWIKDRGQIMNIGQQITARLQQPTASDELPAAIQPDILERAALALAQAYDWKNGGWGSAPKFPQPMTIEFLLRRATVGDHLALEMASHALQAMAKGGMYDVIGGGFARYSTDNQWRVPHFEKMLYDNALLSQAYLHAYLISGEREFRQVCEATLDFIKRELTHPMGGFFSSLDADSEGKEGKYYLWTPENIHEALPQPEEAEFILDAYQITEAGNFEGANVLHRVLDDVTLANHYGISQEQVSEKLSQLHSQMLVARQKRIRPATDDKVLVAWNALALVSFAEAGRYLRRADYVEMATRNARFLLDELHPEDRLLRSWREGKALHNAYLEDYAGLILALLSLYQTVPEPYWFVSATQLAEEVIQHFSDPVAGFFDTRDDHGLLLTRPKDQQDNATPCGNSLAALALLQLSAYTGRNELRVTAEHSLSSIQNLAARYPTAFSHWLCAISFTVNPVSEVAILSKGKDDTAQDLIDVLWEKYRPQMISAYAKLPLPPDGPPLLMDRTLIDSKPTAYVCHDFVCKNPVIAPEDLRSQLDQGS